MLPEELAGRELPRLFRPSPRDETPAGSPPAGTPAPWGPPTLLACRADKGGVAWW